MSKLEKKELSKPLIKKILPQKKAKLERKKKLKRTKVALCVFCVALIISFGINIFQFLKSLDRKISTNLGSDMVMEIDNSGTSFSGIYFPTGIIGGEEFSHNLKIKNASNKKLFIRISAKATIQKNGEPFSSKLKTNALWLEHDGFYYLKRSINEGESLEAFNALTFPNDNSIFQTNVLIICLETFDDLARAKLVWNAPDNWLN